MKRSDKLKMKKKIKKKVSKAPISKKKTTSTKNKLKKKKSNKGFSAKKKIKKKISLTLPLKIDSLDPIVKFVSPKRLKPNPKNDFDPLTKEEYNNLKQNIIANGFLDPLTVKKGGIIVTGENRYNIALELQTHEDKEVRKKFAKIPARYYLKPLTDEEEYDIMESDNLFRRHLTPEQRKARIKQRIRRLYKTELEKENRGGDRKSFKNTKKEKSNLHSEGLILEKSEKLKKDLKPENVLFQNKQNEDKKQSIPKEEKPNITPQSSKEEHKDLAKKVSEKEKIPLGTATRYVAELRKELQPQEPKPEKKQEQEETTHKPLKEIVREFRKRYTQMTKSQKETEVNRLKRTLIKLNHEWDKMNEQIRSNERHTSQIHEKLISVGKKEEIFKINKLLKERGEKQNKK
ncbi:ParB N-terminal domain-containing protein [Leptospira alstonii]|uniref:ParB-like protein n=1 Tax=Leptospira alstonii serovar Sichuan str. 79601 TaxID=1218565 RepID=M6CUH0_9LEPT|nr:ParB N-terminal domain-containing protein [Leptospira alstonii]AGS80453.1 ParB-like protein [Leptospira phage vB_LalZ_80412-LE1]EMJ95369.1 ParB-like protein [Leptospira alstonii serovar Sichuan str. 79601]